MNTATPTLQGVVAMSDNDSTPLVRSGKPAKPSPDFPLFPHACGQWAKKIKGRMRYFGPWNDPAGALASYERQKEDLEAGKEPRRRKPPSGKRGRPISPDKPVKPYADFPLFPHSAGQWAKKIRGKL